MILYINGSRTPTATSVSTVRAIVEQALENNYQIVVGDDPNGIDDAVIDAAFEIGVEIVCYGRTHTPRLERAQHLPYHRLNLPSYQHVHAHMAAQADLGVFFISGDLITENCYYLMQDLNKQTIVITEEPEPADHEIAIICDSSCSGNPGPGGYAALLLAYANSAVQKTHWLEGSATNTTNNIMILTALLETLKHLTHSTTLTVYSNSSYLIDGMSTWINDWANNQWRTASKKPVANRDLWAALLEAAAPHTITYKHVNEATDAASIHITSYHSELHQRAKQQAAIN